MITNSMGLIHTAWIGALMVIGAVVLTEWSLKVAQKDPEKQEMQAA